MSTINFSDANNAQSNSVDDLNRLVFETSNRTKRFFVYGVVTRKEAARALNDYLSKKGVSFKPLFESDMSDAFVSCWRAHQIEVDRLRTHPEEIDDGTGEPGKISYVGEVFFTRVMKHIAQDTCELDSVRVLEFQSYTLVFGHKHVEFWADESFAAEMAREVIVEDYLLESYNGGPLDDIKLRGLWLPTEMFLNEKGNFDINSRDRIFEDLITKDPWENLPLIHHTAAAILSQKKVVKRMDFREFWRFLVAYLQPLIPSWLTEFKLYCIDFKDADIEFYMYRRLDSDVNASLKGEGFLDLGMTSDEADSAIKQYAAEHIGTVTVIDYTRNSDYDPYVQADKFVDFLQKATGAEGIKDGVETNFMKVIYFFLWLVREIPNLEKDKIQEMAKGLKVGQVAKFLWNHPSMVDFPVISLAEFLSRVKFLGAWCHLWYDPNHRNPSSHYSEYPELPSVSFAGDFRNTLKNLFNV